MAPSLAVSVLCVLGLLLVAAFTRHKQEIPLHWVQSHFPLLAKERRASNAKTPPRSVSPERKVPNNTPPSADYKDILPPSQRETLPKIAKRYLGSQRCRLSGVHVSENEIKDNILPFTANYIDYGRSTYTPMGFSIDEIQALGDFPDYAELAGVPLPEPYQEFNIETALPRSYRPFRWAYHQTMCKTL